MPLVAAFFGCCRPWFSSLGEDEVPAKTNMTDIIVHCVASFALGWFAPEVFDNFIKRYKKAAAARNKRRESREVNADRGRQRKKKTYEEDDCPICFVPQSALPEKARTPCGHVFCRQCIQEALCQFGECPICRTPCRPAALRRV
ncbi:hypothetical protein BSKO_13074 [Bryopsis sp. KO-2023]|nr:hypothetical protein BSKO_13074 [Bryopsis sp. KO-2023]